MVTQEQKIIFRKIEDILINYTKYKKRIKDEGERLANPQLKNAVELEGKVEMGMR